MSLTTEAATIAKGEAARSDEGYRGNIDNRSDMVDMYLRNAGMLPDNPDTPGPAWCGIFVYWCYTEAARRASQANPVPTATFGGRSLRDWAQQHQDWVVWTPSQQYPNLQPGDIFAVTNLSHVGMVAEPTSGTATFTSVEGNQTDPEHPDWGTRGIRVKRNVQLGNCAVVVRVPVSTQTSLRPAEAGERAGEMRWRRA